MDNDSEYKCTIIGLYRVQKINSSHTLNKRERNPKGNHKWTIQRNWQHRVHQTQDEDIQSKNTMQYVLYPLYASKHK